MAIVAAVAFLVLLPPALRKDFDHDEHQFVAAGALLAEEGLLPHRDYPYFHVPNLAFVYAGLFRLTDGRLLPARLFSVACAALAVALAVHVASTGLPAASRRTRTLIALGAGLLWIANPVFRYTTGRTWNHDLATLLTVAALLCHLAALGARGTRAGLAASGLLVGLAAGTRFTHLVAAAPLALAVWLVPATREQRIRQLTVFAGGLGVGLLPTLVLFATAPEAFLFGNFAYRAASAAQKAEIGWEAAMTLAGKLRYVKEVIGEPGNLALAVGLAVLVPWRAVLARRTDPEAILPLRLALLLIPVLLVGTLVPTPTFYQYLYAPVPFAVLAIVYGLTWRWPRAPSPVLYGRVFAVVVAMALAWGYKDYREPGFLLRPAKWFPTRVRETAREIRGAVGEGPVLTMAPIYALEGGVRIYKEFATGPFAFRSGHLVPEDVRRRVGVVSPAELDALLQARPPRGILVGFEVKQDRWLVEYAARHRYRALGVGDGPVLWVAPDQLTP